MKKLNHTNLVSLLEVLDDPDEDSLYMVMDYCKKGVVMKIGIENLADPYDEATSRYWFRQMILGIEYRRSSRAVVGFACMSSSLSVPTRAANYMPYQSTCREFSTEISNPTTAS